MSIRLKKGKYNILWPISILKYCLPLICSTFFGHSFLLLMSIFKCLTGKLYYASDASCVINIRFYFNAPLSVIVIILQILLSYMTISMYYNADFVIEGNDLLKKRTSIPDLIFLFCKIIIIATFGFDKETENEHWGIIFAICFITGINVYCNLFLQHYENIIIKKFHDFFSLFLFWGFFCLFISNIFKSWEFGGGFYLFILGLILIIIYCLFYSKTYKEFLNNNFNEMNTSQECLNYIRGYLNIIGKKGLSRDTSMILTSFIEKAEEKCTNKNCVLKKYLESLSKGFDSNFLLLLYAQKLFKIALNKFSRDTTLKIHYIIFLLTKINQKKHAQKELASIKSKFFFFDINFKIYRCKRYLEQYNTIANLEREEGIDTNDLSQEFEYKSNCHEFRRLLSKSSSLYYDFWSSLYSSHLQGIEDFKKLNDIGAELNELIEKIENTFVKLYETKNNDLTIIKLYESYAKNILNDKEKYEKYYNISMNLITDNKIENREKDYSNFDLKILNETDEYNFLIISANEENKGTIINLSLSACPILGYHKHEIIGKNMNILIPEVYHNLHNKLFNKMTEETTTEFFENLSNKKIYIPKFLEFSAFGRNKSKYLIPLDFKVFFVQTEDSELVYVVDFSKKYQFNNDSNDNDQLYCVLTDNNLIIQTFTSNCVEILGLNSNIINSNYDITSFIKHFNDELQSIKTISNKEFSEFNSSELKSNENSRENNNNINENKSGLINLKRKLIKLKYKNQRKIIWKFNNNKNSDVKSDFEKNQISLFSPKVNKIRYYDINENKNKSQKKFLLEVKEAYISGKHIGYYFYFSNIKIVNENNNLFNKLYEEINSPRNKPNLKRPSTKYFKFEEETNKISKINSKEEEEEISHKVSLKLSSIPKKKNSTVNFDFEFNDKKNESAKILGDIFNPSNIIGGKYIPKCNFNFFLDLKSMSYKPSTIIDSCQDLYNTLRFQSMEKINLIYKHKEKEKKTNSSFTSNTENSSKEYSTSEENSYSYFSSSQSNSSNNKKIEIETLNKNKKFQRKSQRKGSIIAQSIFNNENINLNKIVNKNNSKNHRNNDGLSDDYYKVNINKIKLMIYDFNKGMAINSNNKNENKSQVEIIIENYKEKQNINISEDSNYPNISFENYKKEINDKNIKKSTKSVNRNNMPNKNDENNNIFAKEKEFEKEISYALAKKDEQKSIILFYKITFLYVLIISIMVFLEIYFIINEYLKLKENLKLVIYAINLKYFTNFGIYYIRENIIFSIDNKITNGVYIVPDDEPDIYKKQISNIAKETFIDCNSILEEIIGTSYEFCKDTKYILTEKPFNIEILYDDNSKTKNVTTNLYSSMIQVYSSFCNLLVNFEYISVNDPNLFNFIHNALNNLGNALNLQLQLFVSELKVREDYILIYIIIYCCIYLILHIILYFIISRSYCTIVRTKASYIEVFYGIGLSLIKTSIKKCEIFINNLNQNNEKAKIKDIDDETSSLISSFNLNNDNNYEMKNINKNNNNKKLKNQKRKLGDDKKSKKFSLLTRLTMIFSFLYLIIIFFTYFFLTNKFIYCGSYILYMQIYHNNIIELFNSYREYLFDDNHIINGLPNYEYLLEKEKNFYSTNTECINYLTVLSGKISDLYRNYLILQDIGFCGSYISYFNSKEECEDFIGGKDGIINMGFHVLINSFIEEIRNARNYMKLLLDNKILIGSLSDIIDINADDTTYGLDTNKTLKFRMIVFNLEETHSRLNIIFLNIILQYIDKERNITMYAVENFVTNEHIKYVILMIIYIFIYLLTLFFYWFPMIRRMNNEIYKTKNMLSIIPVQILASHPNIKELLNISINND